MRFEFSSNSFLSAHFAAVMFAATLILATTGCEDGKGIVPVSGLVTVDGKPLEHGSIAFRPVSNGESASRAGGGSLELGRFQVSSYKPNDGLLPGKYKVMVTAVEPINEQSQRWHAPKKYGSIRASGLTLEVSKDMEEVKFDLSWKGEKQSKPFIEKF